MAAFFEENVSVLTESSGREPQNKAAAEGASPGGVSCGSSSLEPEDTDIHLLYLSKRAALRGRKRPKPKSGSALSDDDSWSPAGPGHLSQSPELPLETKRLKKANKENFEAGLEMPKRALRQRLGSGDLLSSPSTSRNDVSKTSEASFGLLPGHEGFPAFPEKAVTSPRI